MTDQMTLAADPGVPVKISAAMARQRFNGCDPEYIASTCKAACCRSTTAPTGISVAVLPIEIGPLVRRGAVVIEGLIMPRPGERRCPFQATDTNLCDLHGTGDKPAGCITSPFILTKRDTLIVRNRYRRLKCYEDGARLPAYVAFRASLDLLFGLEEAARIVAHLAAGGGDLVAYMRPWAHAALGSHKATRQVTA